VLALIRHPLVPPIYPVFAVISPVIFAPLAVKYPDGVTLKLSTKLVLFNFSSGVASAFVYLKIKPW
jgi:hypothetical protein